MGCLCKFRLSIDLMQMICLDHVGGERAVDASVQQTSLIYHIFGGYLQSQVKCMQCLHESNRYEPMMDLAVEIQGDIKSLEDALTQFTGTELLDGENKYKCEWCVLFTLLWKF
jgi:ubiquitin carboxyl-terminal hydrolase 36/42